MDVIRLKNMVFYGYHGVTAAEKETGRRFEVDCELEADLAPPGESDSLKDTVDYEAVYQKIRGIVEGKAFSLVESLAVSLANGGDAEYLNGDDGDNSKSKSHIQIGVA